jgi:hypothetical protein
MFEANLKDNVYRVWNRMSSGSYFPPGIHLVEIPKKNGGVRTLGIATVEFHDPGVLPAGGRHQLPQSRGPEQA